MSRVALACALALGLALAAAGSADARQVEFVPGELIVRFVPGATAVEQVDTLRDRGAKVERALPFQRMKLVRLSRGASVHEAAAALERDPDVLYAEPNYVRELARRIPNDPSFVDLWGLDTASDADIDAPEAWDFTTGSEGIVVAVVDTGIAYTHPDLAANIWTSPREVGNGRDDDGNGFVDDVRGWDFVAEDNAPLDEHGHGTHVAGIIGARGDNATGVVGVSWNVKLMPLRAANSSGSLSDADIAAAFRYAGRMGARVVNGSFGSPGFSRTLLEAIEAHPETLFVFAAGNGGADGRGDNNDASPEFPCSYAAANVVCAAASTQSGDLASFSNFGPAAVDLVAPGQLIVSTWVGGRYASAGGTSMAAPFVAGVAALGLSVNVGLTAGDLRRAILGSTDALPALAGVVSTGGRVNAAGAVSAVLAAHGAAPPLPPPAPSPAPAAPAPPAAADTAAPNTRITEGPAAKTTRARALFRFVSSEGRSTFQCRLDRGAWRSCASPRAYGNLKRGSHTFSVRAKDAAGNVDPTPAVRRWHVG